MAPMQMYSRRVLELVSDMGRGTTPRKVLRVLRRSTLRRHANTRWIQARTTIPYFAGRYAGAVVSVRHRPARLAHIKHKQRTLCMAGRSHTSGIQQRAVVKAHMTHGDNIVRVYRAAL